MNKILFVAAIAAFITVSVCADTSYTLYKINSDSAKCLDGTAPAFYYRKGSLTTKWLIFFEGGGWCGTPDPTTTLADCYSRSQTDLGSSKNYPSTSSFDQWGILSPLYANNKYYYEYNKVFVKYCDGTGHQGTHKDPVPYQSHNLYFRGYNNTDETVNYLMNTLDMKSADEVLIAGCSAGGLATYTWVDNIAARFDQTKVRVYSMPDAGLFLDEENVQTQDFSYRKIIQNFMYYSNQEIDVVNPLCSAAYPDEKWKCMFTQYLIQFIKTPLFISESEYDSWSVPNILGIQCTQNLTLTPCTDNETQIISQYRQDTMTVIQTALDNNPSWGAWSPSCIYHCYAQGSTYSSSSYEVPALSWNTLEDSLLDWKSGKQNSFIDSQPWPNNKPCSGVSSIQGCKEKDLTY